MSIDEYTVCRHCSSRGGAHTVTCHQVALAVAQMPLPQPTAYDRDQQALRDRVTAQAVLMDDDRERLDAALRRIEQLESRVAANADASVSLVEMVIDRLTARIEHLELDMARQKAWSRPPAEMCLKCGTGFVTPQHALAHSCGSKETP